MPFMAVTGGYVLMHTALINQEWTPPFSALGLLSGRSFRRRVGALCLRLGGLAALRLGGVALVMRRRWMPP